MNFSASNEEMLKHNCVYTVLMQEISTVFADQVPEFIVFGEVNSVLASEFSAVYRVV
jgi:hypothetical protein